MERGHAVDPVASHAGEMGHTDMLFTAFINNGQPRGQTVVTGIAGPDLLKKAVVDFKDNLQMPRKQASEKRQRPFFKRFGQQGMIGIGQGISGDIPRLCPIP